MPDEMSEQSPKKSTLEFRLPGLFLGPFLLVLIISQTVTGVWIALRKDLNFYDFSFLTIHRGLGVLMAGLLLLYGFPRIFQSFRAVRFGIYFSLLVSVFTAFINLAEVPYQINYPLAALAMAGFLILAVRRDYSLAKSLPVIFLIWLLGFTVVQTGVQLCFLNSLRNNFYHYLHRYGALAAAALFFWLVRFQPVENRILRIARIPVFALFLIVLLIHPLKNGGNLTEKYAAKRLPVAPQPLQVEMAEAGSGKVLVPNNRFWPSTYCSAGDCHNHHTIYEQWYYSPHRLAGKTEPYKKLLKQYAKEKGPNAVVFCSRCHTPLIALSGLLDNPDDPAQDAMREEGISCQYCHVITAVGPVAANGLATLRFPRTHLDDFDLTDPQMITLRDSFLTANLMPHRKIFKHPVQTTAEYCAACHRVNMPMLVNGKPLVLGDTHTPWLTSQAQSEGVDCRACHLPLTRVTRNPAHPWHAAGDHRFVGTCQSLSLLVPGELAIDKNYDEITLQRLLGNIEITNYEKFYLALIRHPKLKAYNRYLKNQTPIAIDLTVPAKAQPATTVSCLVHSQNNTHAHVLPSGPLDLNELWLEVTATDARGRLIYSTPGLDENHYLSDKAISLGIELYDADNQRILNHRFWAIARVANKRVLAPDESRDDRFEIALPADAAFPIRIKARWNYRRYNQHMADWVYGPGQVTFPVALMAEKETIINAL
ncbi:MAG: hypothetical protein GX444_08675 [Myxococcales bacterium]|nr:hypothetical protein [Myxococcales bacterium]